MPSYPGALMTPTVVADDPGGTEIIAAHHNNQDDEILAIETELGTDVAGSKTNLKTRLAVALADDGTLRLAASTVLTIASGAITVTQNFHRIATEGGAASDDLDTINGLAVDGTVLILRTSTSNDVVLKDGTGNIQCVGGSNITLSDTDELAMLIYDTNLTAWIAGKFVAGGTLTTSAGAANNYIAVYTASGNVEGTDDLQWSGTLLTIGDGTAGRDYYILFDGETNNGIVYWMEDEDYFRFADDIQLPDNEKVILGTGADAYIYYDGTNLLIDPDVVGTGNVTIDTAQAAALTIGNGAAGVDYAITVNGETNDGTITWMEDEAQFKTSAVWRGATSLYRRYYHVSLAAANPGGSGPTWVAPGANSIGGWRLDAATELLYLNTDVHADWDGATDLILEVKFEVNVDNSGGAAGDTVDLKAAVYYKGTTETVTKSQTVEVPTTVGASAQYKQFKAVFTIDWDATSNVMEVGDAMRVILNLETDTSEVDDIVVNDASFYYQTTHASIESGDV